MILVDTNILVYACDRSEGPKHDHAIEVLAQIEADSLGVLSTQVLNEFYWNATRKIRIPLSAEEAQSLVRLYIASWDVVSITTDLVMEGIRGARSHQLAYWDALIWAAAKLNDVQVVLSEDFSHGQQIETVTFLNPFTDGLVSEP